MKLAAAWADVDDAAGQLAGVAHRTPVATARTLDELLGAHLFLKCENLQRAGAFKFRGAYNAISRLSAEELARGVVAYSSGNHAQAVALASRLMGTSATIVMPADAPAAKRRATAGYGARVVLYDRDTGDREATARRIQEEERRVMIPPFEHRHVIAGQGTAAKELIEEVGSDRPLDLLLVPCSGGGLLSGSALAARHLAPGCRVVGIEPEGADDANRSFRSGRRERVEQPRSVADGLLTKVLGELTFPIIRACVDDMATVSEQAIVHAMRFLWERLKLVVEPSGAVGLAAAMSGRVEVAGRRVGLILSGGNVDLEMALELFRSAPPEDE